jgi:two-component system, OmpR family, response regulator VicR
MRRILVVDDEEGILKIISLMLEKAGYEVVTAGNGADGIQTFNDSPFDVVITDLLMPGINGDELARYVRNVMSKDIPIIGITGTPWCADLNCFDLVMKKPFSINKLVENVRKLEGVREEDT